MSQRREKVLRQTEERFQGIGRELEELWNAVECLRDNQRDMVYQSRRRRRERESRERRRKVAGQRAALVGLVMVLVLVAMLAWRPAEMEAVAAEVTPTHSEEWEDPLEDEKITTALVGQGYFLEEVPLAFELQDVLRTQCEIWGCPYPLALAVIQVESGFQVDAVGAVGEVGLMQLNPGPRGRYHKALQEATGKDPETAEGNLAGGCYLLGGYLAEHGSEDKALMAYNMGEAGAARKWAEGVESTAYVEKVMDAMERWKKCEG